MKKTVFINLLILFQLVALAQGKFVISDKSVIKHISFQKNSSDNYIKAIPNFQISDFIFVDENNDNAIEAEERSFIRFSLLNVGNGLAKEVKLVVSLQNSSATGLEYEREKELGDIYSMREKQVSISVEGRPDLVSGVAGFRIDILDDDETNPDPLELEIPTKRFSQPDVIVANSAFYTDYAVQIETGKPIYLKTLIQNVGQGTASQVQVEFLLPSGCTHIRSNNIFHVGQLSSGEFIELEFPFRITNEYKLTEVHIDIVIKEKYELYGDHKVVALSLLDIPPPKSDIQLKPMEFVNQNSEDSRPENLPDIELDVPKNLVKYSNRLALVIGNQDYEFISPPEGHNSNSVRDALVIKDYLIRVLGFYEDNIFLLTNATSDNISNHIQLLSRVASRVSNSEIMMYFSGLSSFDSQTQTPYLLPVDARGDQMVPNQNIYDLFQLLSQTRARKISFFFDASILTARDISSADKSLYVEKMNQHLSDNMILYCAAQPGQTALPYPDGHHGLFTYYLLKNLKDTRGKMSYAGLGDYISKNVSVESLKNFSKEQDPAIFTGSQAFSWWRNLKLNDY